MILSVSRRTDIPAYYSEWFMNRLREGYVFTRNPMNHSQVRRIRLSPEVIDCIVFWTKDPLPLLKYLPEIDALGYKYYFQFTLTPYGQDIEKNLRDKKDILKTFIKLSEIIGSDKVIWRYDPIILNDRLTADWHKESFEYLCGQLSGYTKACTISFVDIYAKLRLPVNSGVIRDISDCEMNRLAESFARTGGKQGIKLIACSERLDLSGFGINPASCIDKDMVEKVCGYKIDAKRDSGQRTGCGCIQSIDIGAYNTCKNSCVYCYANFNSASVAGNYESHNPASDILIGTVGEAEKITERTMKLLKMATIEEPCYMLKLKDH